MRVFSIVCLVRFIFFIGYLLVGRRSRRVMWMEKLLSW